MGLVSAKYNLQGELKEPKFKLYPLTALLPNAIKKNRRYFFSRFLA